MRTVLDRCRTTPSGRTRRHGPQGHAQEATCKAISIVFESRRQVCRMLSQEIPRRSTGWRSAGRGGIMGIVCSAAHHGSARRGGIEATGAIRGHETQASTGQGGWSTLTCDLGFLAQGGFNGSSDNSFQRQATSSVHLQGRFG